MEAEGVRHLKSGRMFGVSRASWIINSDATGSAHTAWTRAVDGASEEVLFAYSVGAVGVGRDDG